MCLHLVLEAFEDFLLYATQIMWCQIFCQGQFKGHAIMFFLHLFFSFLFQMSYGGGGLGGNDLGMGPGLGLPGGGVGNMGPLSLVGLPDEPPILGPGGRMVGLDGGMGGRAGGLNLNGVAAEADALRGNVDVLPPDASSTLFVDGLPQDCSRREAARILHENMF